MKVLHLYSKYVNTISNLYDQVNAHKKTIKTVVPWCPEELTVCWLKPEQRYEVEAYLQNLNIEFLIHTNREMPMYWAFHTVYSNLYENKTLPIKHERLKKSFVTLNGKGWGHRCQFIDKLAELDLLKNNYYSWNLWKQEVVNSNYKFNYFNGKTKILDNPDSNNYYSVPDEFKTSLFSVICETSLNNIFFTEKLWHAIYHKRPFVVYGAPNYHARLQELGFKLFEPVIKYDFDQEHRTARRLEMIGDQLKRLQKYSKSLQGVREYFEPTLEHNFQNMLRLLDNEPQPKYLLEGDCKYKSILQINTLQKFRKLMK